MKELNLRGKDRVVMGEEIMMMCDQCEFFESHDRQFRELKR